jgi:hypothetical protein
LRLATEFSTMGADQRQHALRDRNDKSEDECEVSDFGCHVGCLVGGAPDVAINVKTG